MRANGYGQYGGSGQYGGGGYEPKSLRRKRRKKRAAAIVSVLCLFLVAAAVYCQRNVTRVLFEISEATMRASTTIAVNDAVFYTLSDGTKYEDLIEIERGENGEVLSISANALKINKIARDTAAKSQSNLKNLSADGIPVPLGALTGVEALAGFGPRIHIRIIPVSSVICAFTSSFESVGINQTKHSVYLNVVADISIVTPARTEKFAVTTDVLVCESVLIGNVPDAYLQTDVFGNHLDLQP